MSRFSLAAAVAIVFALAAALSRASAQSADSAAAYRVEVTALLEKSWEKSADGLSLAAERHGRATALLPGDPRADFALALVEWHYLKFDQAEKTLTRLTAGAPGFWPGRQAKIYLSVLMKKHSAALTELNQFSQHVAADQPTAHSEAERREAVEFMGRVFGYYEGPALKQVSQTTVAELRGQVMARLTTAERDLFGAAFGAVTERYTQLDEEKRQSQVEALEAEKRAKELALQQLGAEKAAVDAGKQAIQKQAQDSLERTQAEVTKLDQQIAPLEAQLGQLLTQAQLVQGRIAQLDASISIALAQADATDDPVEASILQSRANFLSGQIRQAEFELQAINARAIPLQAQRNGLLQQRGQAIARYEADAKRLGVEAAKLGRNDQRIGVQQKLALKPATGASPQVQGKMTIAASITSYVEFPLEREKIRILNSF